MYSVLALVTGALQRAALLTTLKLLNILSRESGDFLSKGSSSLGEVPQCVTRLARSGLQSIGSPDPEVVTQVLLEDACKLSSFVEEANQRIDPRRVHEGSAIHGDLNPGIDSRIFRRIGVLFECRVITNKMQFGHVGEFTLARYVPDEQ